MKIISYLKMLIVSVVLIPAIASATGQAFAAWNTYLGSPHNSWDAYMTVCQDGGYTLPTGNSFKWYEGNSSTGPWTALFSGASVSNTQSYHGTCNNSKWIKITWSGDETVFQIGGSCEVLESNPADPWAIDWYDPTDNREEDLTPSAPTNLTKSGGAYENPVLNWTGSTCATDSDFQGYKIKRVWNGTHYYYTSNTTWTDTGVMTQPRAGSSATYNVSAIDAVNESSSVSVVFPFIVWQSKEMLGDAYAPASFSLSEAYPNPFNPSTTLSYNLPAPAKIFLEIYDVSGRRIADWSTINDAGRYSQKWHGMDSGGNLVPSGVYLYRLVAIPTDGSNPFIEIRKMLLLK